MTIDGVHVKGEGFDCEELARYVAYVKEREPDVVSLRVTLGTMKASTLLGRLTTQSLNVSAE